MDKRLAMIFVIIGAALTGFIGLSSRVLSGKGYDETQIAMVRMISVSLGMAVALLLIDRKGFLVKKQHIILLILLGIGKGGADYTFAYAQNTIPLTLAAVLQLTAPFFVIFLSYFFFKEKFTKYRVFAVVTCIAGAVLVSGVFTGGIIKEPMGIAVGISSALFLAIYFMSTKKLLDENYSPMTVLFYAYFIGMLVLIPGTDLVDGIDRIGDNPVIIGHMFCIGVLCTLIPHFMIVVGEQHLKALTVSVLMTSEIISSAVVGLIYFNESITIATVIGVALIIASIVLINKSETVNDDTKPSLDSG